VSFFNISSGDCRPKNGRKIPEYGLASGMKDSEKKTRRGQLARLKRHSRGGKGRGLSSLRARAEKHYVTGHDISLKGGECPNRSNRPPGGKAPY